MENKNNQNIEYAVVYFWSVVLILFAIGCGLMYKFKTKFIDMI